MAYRSAATRYDESDVKVRPGRGSRPRSKQRPQHQDAEKARVVAVDRGRYTCVVGTDGRQVTAMTARELGRKAVVVGDNVDIVGNLSGREGTLARIVRVADRTTVLRRSSEEHKGPERIIVANVDQMMIVTAVADPPPRPRLIDRCLVAAFDAGIDPVLCVTKTDLGNPDELRSMYEPLRVTTITTRKDSPSLEAIRSRLHSRTTVLVGHSGVGKSTLVNALVPHADRVTAQVNATTGRGRHTSTSAVALALPNSGWIIDTPGIRSFGLAHVRAHQFVLAFPDLAPAIALCPPGCTHTTAEPDCSLNQPSTSAELDPARIASFRRLLTSQNQH